MITESNIMFDLEANDFLGSKGYSVIDTIGRGGFASVYTVLSIKYNLTFVCKISSIKRTKSDEYKREAFRNELDTLQKCYHPNIVQIYEHFIHKNRLYIIMEYCPNGSLLDIINKNGPLSGNAAIQVFQQIISAIDYLHSNNIAHLDIKPANILIDKNNKIKVTDFGLSQTFSDNYQICTAKRGSLLYAAPEILVKPSFDPFKADVYSIGVTLYQIVTGKLPFRGSTVSELYYQQRVQVINFPQSIRRMRKLIRGCLKFDQDDRPTTSDLLSQIHTLMDSTKSAISLPKLALGKEVPSYSSARRSAVLREPLVSAMIIGKRRNQL